MRVEGTVRGSDLLSPLAVDLAATRVSVAALKVAVGSPPSEEERSWSIQLRQSLSKELMRLQGSSSIPVEVVPRESMRHELEETLSTLAHVDTIGKADVDLLERTIGLLTRLEEGALSDTDAADLVGALSLVGSRSDGPALIPDLSLVLQVGRAG